jgi:hypothetical protein
MNIITHIITLCILISIGLVILKTLHHLKKYIHHQYYQKLVLHLPLIQFVFILTICSYFILGKLFENFNIGLAIEVVLFIIIKSSLENCYYRSLFLIKEKEVNNFTFRIGDEEGTITKLNLTSLNLTFNKTTTAITYKTLFKNGYKKTEKGLVKKVFNISFKIQEKFNVEEFEKFLFTVKYIHVDDKPTLLINNQQLIIELCNKNIAYKKDIYNAILEYKHLDEI